MRKEGKKLLCSHPLQPFVFVFYPGEIDYHAHGIMRVASFVEQDQFYTMLVTPHTLVINREFV